MKESSNKRGRILTLSNIGTVVSLFLASLSGRGIFVLPEAYNKVNFLWAFVDPQWFFIMTTGICLFVACLLNWTLLGFFIPSIKLRSLVPFIETAMEELGRGSLVSETEVQVSSLRTKSRALLHELGEELHELGIMCPDNDDNTSFWRDYLSLLWYHAKKGQVGVARSIYSDLNDGRRRGRSAK